MTKRLRINESALSLRPLNPEKDLPMILSDWLKSYRNSVFALPLTNEVYYYFHQRLIHQILKDPTNSVTVIADPQDPDTIMGWVCYSEELPLVHYIYIKYPFRKVGLGAHMLGLIQAKHKQPLMASHIAKGWARKVKVYGLTYNPYVTGAAPANSADSSHT